ncbi:MAG: copper resistance protein B [Gammaproteobacteria bacterium]|nr:copper resistance protein B [Gammaproteobacteria bacterium]
MTEKTTMIINRAIIIAAAMLVPGLSPVHAQEPAAQPAMKMDEAAPMAGMDHGTMKHGSMRSTDQDAPTAAQDMGEMDHANGMGQEKMQGGPPPANARSPDYSEGYGFGDIPRPVFADEHNFASLLVNRLESVRTDDNTSTTYDLQGWYGRDYDRVVLKAEGDIDSGRLEDASTELLWGHAVATFWDTQIGVRYDGGEDPDRAWLAFGVQGLAPYWFELDAAAYIGEAGRTAISLEAEYELLLTQKLILQPRIEADWYGKRDAARGLGDGLSDLSAGLRLRYEVRREFAPYLGVEWARKFGETEDFARSAGLDPNETRFVAGLRFWF